MSPLCSNNNPYASFGATLARDEEQNLWSTPHDVTHTEADDDRVLYNMIVGRSQLDKDSEVRTGNLPWASLSTGVAVPIS